MGRHLVARREGALRRKWRQRSAQIESTLKHNRIDTAMVSTEGDYVSELIKLFKQR